MRELATQQQALTADVVQLMAAVRQSQQQTAAEIAAVAQRIQRFSSESREKLAREVVDAVGHRGDHQTSMYRAFVGTEAPLVSPPQPIPLTSTLCHQHFFLQDQYRYWAKAMKDRPTFVRKQWEWIYIAQALFERGRLRGGQKAIVFGAGQEPLPALFASFGVQVVVSDQDLESAVQQGWAQSHQHSYDLSPLNNRGICTDKMFRELVSFRAVDMNAIPAEFDEQFDFCWSSCALEHLGSLRHGLDFIENSMKTLRPGGIAIHTTEFNLSSNTHTIETPHVSMYRRCDIEAFVGEMTGKGYIVSPVDWELGEGFAETVIDLPPYNQRGEPHLRLKIGDYDATSIGLIIEKPPA